MADSYTELLEQHRDTGQLVEDNLSAADRHRGLEEDIFITYDEDTTTVEMQTEEPLDTLTTFIKEQYESKRYSITAKTDALPENHHYRVTDIDEDFEIGLTALDDGTAIYIEHPSRDGAYDEALTIAEYLDQ